MSDFHTDPLTGRNVLVAENRSGRPNEFSQGSTTDGTASSPFMAVQEGCPFCVGAEHLTPETVVQSLDGNGDWQQRVVPNKFPAVASLTEAISSDSSDHQMVGVQEVIIESRSHRTLTSQLTVEEMATVLEMYAERLDHWRQEERLGYRLLFKNVGRSAGASLTHLHSQLITLPYLPPHVEAEASRLASHQAEHGSCGWCDAIDREQTAAERLVSQSEHFVAYCPEAGRQPYETFVLPRKHEAEFESLLNQPQRLAELAKLIHPLVAAIEKFSAPHGYNMMLQTAPSKVIFPSGPWHWRLEITPRIASLAGLELATGLYVSTLSAEHAAEQLRQALAAKEHASSLA